MNKEAERKQWTRMLFSLTDPEERDKARMKTEIKERALSKKIDTGLQL